MNAEEPAEHLEHAHHNSHAQDPFDKRVAGSMAVIAVILAIVALLSHSANNESTSSQVESGKKKTEAADLWSEYQAKKIRAHTDDAMTALVKMNIAARDAPATRPAEAAAMEAWAKETEHYNDDAKNAQKEALAHDEESKQLQDESAAQTKKAGVLELAELTVQVSLVLCSVAILSKRHAFWFAGILIATAGVCVGAYGMLMHG